MPVTVPTLCTQSAPGTPDGTLMGYLDLGVCDGRLVVELDAVQKLGLDTAR